jgi:hypothetical protein
MSLFTRNLERVQVEWGSAKDGHPWYVNIDAPITDPIIIELAKTIVDHCSPQRYGPQGVYGYSFLKREYVLNLLLFHYADHGFFPSGHICITDDWIYGDPVRTKGGRSWFLFKFRRIGRKYLAGWWINIPDFEGISSASSSYEPDGH